MKKLIPTSEQEAAISEILQHTATLNGSELGTGKTCVGVEAILRNWSVRSLIIAPLGTLDNWQATMLAQSDGEESVKLCANTKKEFKQNLEDFMNKVSGHYFMGREFFTTLDWTTVETRVNGKIKKKRKQKHIYKNLDIDFAIFDEVHFASSADSRASKSWGDLDAGVKMGQSATWYGNKFENAYTVAKCLWDNIVPRSFPLWVEDWCTAKDDHFSFYKKKVTGERVPGAFVASLPSYVQLRADNEHPVPEVRWVDLTSAQRGVYDRLEKNMVAKIEDDYLITKIPVEMRTRLRQLTLGEVTLNPREKKVTDEDGNVAMEPYLDVDFAASCKSSKFDELLEIIKDYPDDPMMITMFSARFARVVAEKLNAHFKKEVAGLYAGTKYTSISERDDVKERFIAGGLRYFVGVIDACGTGLDGFQRVCHTLVSLEISENGVANDQLVGRLNRKGQPKPVVHWIINARNTWDDEIMSTQMQKALANNASRAKRGNS